MGQWGKEAVNERTLPGVLINTSLGVGSLKGGRGDIEGGIGRLGMNVWKRIWKIENAWFTCWMSGVQGCVEGLHMGTCLTLA